jgi:hypothetical protein
MKHRVIWAAGWLLIAGLAALAGCTPKAELTTRSEVDIKPIEIKPIYITIDVNIRVDRQLDKYLFADEGPAPASQPAKPG